ncbi:hypothetical protein ACIG5E_07825 [Kitasatospora sp. NPDC053057]|uniref:hypothetical protein n=1 Tax=Kitasatospora sp. NPDC053057 TaxID=3364062 RepID=UPI0037CC5B45
MTAVLHTVRLAPLTGPPSGGPSAALFDARVVSPTGARHGLLAAGPPTAPRRDRPGPGFVDEHLVLDLTEPAGRRWRRQADVLHLGLLPAAHSGARLAGALSAHPGCAVATAEHRSGAVLLLARTGAPLLLRPGRGAHHPGAPALPLALGSLAHAWLAAGRALTELDRSDWFGAAACRTGGVTGGRLRRPGRRDGG